MDVTGTKRPGSPRNMKMNYVETATVGLIALAVQMLVVATVLM